MNIPEGWPTRVMIEAAWAAMYSTEGNVHLDTWDQLELGVKAALAAAPTPPAPEGPLVGCNDGFGTRIAQVLPLQTQPDTTLTVSAKNTPIVAKINEPTKYMPPAQGDEPVAELVAHTERNHALIKITKRSTTYLALGTPLYTHPDNSELRISVEEAIGIINDAIERLDDVPCRIVMRLHDAVENLRSALEERHE